MRHILFAMLLTAAALLSAPVSAQVFTPIGNAPKPLSALTLPGPVIVDPVAHMLVADVVDGACRWPDAQIRAAESITLVCVQYGANAPALWQAQVGSPLLRSQLLDTGAAIGPLPSSQLLDAAAAIDDGVARVRWAAFDLRNDSDHDHALDAVVVRVFGAGS
jgi:hypothetical protein